MRLLLPILLAAPLAAFGCGGFFYEAPPTLEAYPERLPGKTMCELLREAHPPTSKAATFEELEREARDLASSLVAQPREGTLAKIDKALEHNRQGEYRKRFANFLNDLHDLLVDGSAAEAATDGYLAVRLAALDKDDGFIHRPKIPDGDHRTAEEREDARLGEDDPEVEALTASAEKASATLRPHWQVLLGAYRFRRADFGEAARIFTAVVEDSPQHPRAEIACLMLARSRLEQWRDATKEAGATPESLDKLYRAADTAFAAYLTAYPQGRFALDVPGWRVDLERERGNTAGALALLLEQMDASAHPEIVRRAARELEIVLQETDLVGSEQGDGMAALNLLPIEDLAKRPLAALAVIYHFLDARSRGDLEEFMQEHGASESDVIADCLTPVLRLRRAGREVLPKIAAALGARNGELAREWRPKYLAALAWSASELGNQREAIQLCEAAGPALAASDDLAFVHAVSLQRANDLPAARIAFQELQTKFPDSPLRAESGFRLVTVLRDQNEAGLAVEELLGLADSETTAAAAFLEKERRREELVAQGRPLSDQPAIEGIPPLHLSAELDQWLDTLLQFAPLDQLERGLAAVRGNPVHEARFRDALRFRHLAAEHFASAERYSPPLADQTPAPPTDDEKASAPLPLTGQDWTSVVSQLDSLTGQLAATRSDVAKAKLEFDLAGTWAHARGRLTLPSEHFHEAFSSFLAPSSEERRRNARAAGYPDETAARALDDLDELQHALPHYLAAADAAKGTALGARALRSANTAMLLLAERSPYQAARAFETNASALSRHCYDRLKQEYPGPHEDRSNDVWWSFRPPAEVPWTQQFSREITAKEEMLILQSFTGQAASEDTDSDQESNDPWRLKLEELCRHSELETPALVGGLEALRQDFLPSFVSAFSADILNDMDDILLFLHEPGLTPKARESYLSFRLRKGRRSGNTPDLEPWRDYVTFLWLVREPVSLDPISGLPRLRPMTERMREFLAKYPQSHKREAAMARLAIAAVRECHGHAGVVDFPAAEPPQLPGGQTLALTRANPKAKVEARQALSAYEHEFPDGRYAADLRLWRGALAIDERDWSRALPALTAALDDPQHADLHLDAALNLGFVFLQLLDQPEERHALIDALQTQPAAQRRLWQFLQSATPGARLRCLEGCLREQLGSEIPLPTQVDQSSSAP